MDDNAIMLLTTIAKNTESAANANIGIAIIAGCFAIIAAATSGWSIYLQSKSNNHAQIVTTERLRWLQDIRKGVANAFTLMDMQLDLVQRPNLTQQQLDDLSKSIMGTVHELLVFLNPDKSYQGEICTAFTSMQNLILACIHNYGNSGLFSQNKTLYTVDKSKAYRALVELGKETWNQIKQELK